MDLLFDVQILHMPAEEAVAVISARSRRSW
jgi:hypothetical protein